MKDLNLVKFRLEAPLLCFEEHVFDAQTSTLQIFTKIGLPLVNACFEGINGISAFNIANNV